MKTGSIDITSEIDCTVISTGLEKVGITILFCVFQMACLPGARRAEEWNYATMRNATVQLKRKEGTRLNMEWGFVQMDLTGFCGDPYSSFSNYIPLIVTLGWLRGGTIGPYVEDMETPKGQSAVSSWVP